MSVGREPQRNGGYALIDTEWVRGVAAGFNRLVQSIAALAGGGQAGATLPGFAELVEIRTVATGGDSVMLPFAQAGRVIKMYNSSGNSANVFANPAVNKLTGVQDTINAAANANAYAIASHVAVEFFCPRDGIWAAIKTS